jgi:hypothetical protein
MKRISVIIACAMLASLGASAQPLNTVLHSAAFGPWQVLCFKDPFTDEVRCGLKAAIGAANVTVLPDVSLDGTVRFSIDGQRPTAILSRTDGNPVRTFKCCVLIDLVAALLIKEWRNGKRAVLRFSYHDGSSRDVDLDLTKFDAALKDFDVVCQKFQAC